MPAYASHVSTRRTPQTEPIPGKPMVQNSAGGYSFGVDCWTRLNRFLVLGCEGGSYYAGERQLTKENAGAVLECADKDFYRTLQTVVGVSEEGRAPKNSPAIFALALLSSRGRETDSLALDAVQKVCRTATHFFEFLENTKHLRGRGRALKRAMQAWYTAKEPREVAYQVTKYQNRGNWTHRDVLRLAKPKAEGELDGLFAYVAGKPWDKLPAGPSRTLIEAVEEAKKADEAGIVRLVREHDLVRECIPTRHLNSPAVWEALLEKMPLTAMVRNLGKMSAVGLLKPMSQASRLVAERLRDDVRIKKSSLHPLSVLLAGSTYRAGRGVKGSLTWMTDNQIVEALDDCFYKAFGNIEPTGKRYLLALDVSGSMTCTNIAGTFLTPRDASAAMALVTARTESLYHTMAFSNTFLNLNITGRDSLGDALKKVSGLPFGGTDCAVPMMYALQNKIEVDVFVVLTDSETWAGLTHPTQALREYREKMGIGAKLAVCGMVSNGFSIADPSDAGQLDLVGFDTATPQVLADFLRG